MPKINDCRRKEVLSTERKGGDLAIIFRDNYGNDLFESWFQMKKPYKKTYEEIEVLFKAIKNKLKRQD